MPLDEYALLSLVVEGTLLLGVLVVISIFRTLNRYVKRGRLIEALQIAGGFIMALGMTYLRATYVAPNPIGTNLIIATLFTLAGSFLVILPFFLLQFIKLKMKAQVFALLLSSLIYLVLPLPTMEKIGRILLLSSLLLPLLLMDVVSSLATCSQFNKKLLRVASWLLVLHAWLRYYAIKNPETCIHYGILLIYFAVLVTWVYSTLKTYAALRRWL